MLLMASTDRLFSCLFNNLEESKQVYQHPRSQRGFLADFASLKTKNLKDIIHSPAKCKYSIARRLKGIWETSYTYSIRSQLSRTEASQMERTSQLLQ